MQEYEEQFDVTVHAGFPNPAIAASLRDLDLNQLIIKHPSSTFYFRVQGNEWKDSGIFDSDLALVDRAQKPQKTDTVIWYTEGREGFNISRYTALPPQATLWGVVTTVIHQLSKR